MRRILLAAILLQAFGAVVLVSSCGGSRPPAETAIEGGDFQRAIQLLTVRVAQDPEDWQALRNLGVAYLHTGDAASAIKRLQQARDLHPQDPGTVFHLGAAQEKAGHLEAAVAAYRDYLNLGTKEYREAVTRRLRWLARQAADQEAQRTLAQQDSLVANPHPVPRSLAVTHFASVGSDPAFSAALSDWIVTDLAKVESADLVLLERLRLDALLREIELGQSKYVDPGTAPKVGRLLGAERVLSGGVTKAGTEAVRADLSLTEAGTSATQDAATAESKAEDFIGLEKDLVFQVLTALGIQPTRYERAQIELVPTRDLRAILAYGEGLTAEWAGNDAAARAAYSRALAYDAGYGAPRVALEALAADPGSLDDLLQNTLSLLAAGPGGAGDRLAAVGDLIGAGLWPINTADTRPTPVPLGIPRPPDPGRDQ